MLQLLRSLDLAVFEFLNGFAGRWHELDLFLGRQQDHFLVSGILFMAVFCWFWFRPGAEQERNRAIVLTMMGANLLAIGLNRMIAVACPFRTRPMYDPSLPFRNPHLDGLIHYNLENWSSFPSDTATWLFVMVAALWLMSRRAGLLFGLYALFFLVATRVYLGVHYPGDIFVGAVLGAATMLAANRWGGNALARRLLAHGARHPHWFYPIGFLYAYELGTAFGDIRHMQHGVLVKAQRALQAEVHSSPVAALALAVLVAVTVGVAMAARRRLRRGPQDA